MKKKINVKLTLFLVSLFIGLLLILGNKNKYCLSFGFIFAGISLVFYVLYKKQVLDQTLDAVYLEMEELDLNNPENIHVLQELDRIRKKTIKQKRSVTILFNLAAFLMVAVGIIGFF